jgi:hypothetical protein
MHFTQSIRFPFAPVLIAGLLAGCSATGSPTPSAAITPAVPAIQSMRQLLAKHTSARARDRADFVDVAAVKAPHGNQTILSSGAGSVSVWGSNGRLNALISTGLSAPEGITTDAAENLYIVNNLGANVLVYPKPYTVVSFVLNDFHESANDVAVSKSGIVAVTNIYNTVTGGPGSVSIYAKGATAPCATILDPNWSEMAFDTFDGSGNLFFDGLNAAHSKVIVGEISGGCGAKSIKTLATANAFQSIGSIEFAGGKLLIVDPLGVTVYSYTFSHHALVRSATTVLPHAQYPLSFAMTADKTLWIADYYAWAEYEYTYPGDAMIRTLKSSLTDAPYSIAVNPAVNPD